MLNFEGIGPRRVAGRRLIGVIRAEGKGLNHRMANIYFRNRRTKLSKGSGEMPHRKRLRLLEVGVEPSHGAADAVAAMFGLEKHVAFVLVDDKLGFDVRRF